MRFALVASCTLSAAACGFSSTAAAIDGGRGSGSGSGPIDARPDGPPPDASNLFTLTQSTSTVADGHSLGCATNTSDPDTDNFNLDNTFYRVFDLSQVIPPTSTSTMLHIDDVRVVLQLTMAGASAGGQQPVNIELATYSGAVGDSIDLGSIDSVQEVSIMAADHTSNLTVPMDADFSPSDKLVISVNFPDGQNDGNRIKIGTNAAGESGHTYWYAPDCKIGTTGPGDSGVWMQHYIDTTPMLPANSHGDAIIEAHGHF